MSLHQTKKNIINLLLIRKDFQQVIADFREKWDIDIEHQGPIFNNWNLRWGQKCRAFSLDSGVDEKDIHIPFLRAALKRDLNKILRYFELDHYFYDFLFTYFTSGKVIIGNTDLILELDPNDIESGLKMNLSTFADRDDAKKAQKFAQIFYPYLPAKAKAPTASLHQIRNLKIIELKQQGMKSKNIAKKLNDEMKLKLTANEVDKIFSRFRRALKLPPK